MAASSAMQYIFASPLTHRASSLKRTNHCYLRSLQYAPPSPMKVRCMVEDDQNKPASNSVSPPPSQPLSSPPPKPKVSTKFSDLLAFSGPAPERINGRLAMIGFVAALGVELSNGQDVFDQISNGGIPWFLATSVVLSLASLIPLFKGVSAESKSDGFMTSDAELWNGRFAMLGLIALAFAEYVKGGTLV